MYVTFLLGALSMLRKSPTFSCPRFALVSCRKQTNCGKERTGNSIEKIDESDAKYWDSSEFVSQQGMTKGSPLNRFIRRSSRMRRIPQDQRLRPGSRGREGGACLISHVQNIVSKIIRSLLIRVTQPQRPLFQHLS